MTSALVETKKTLLSLDFPALVEHGRAGYELRPLLMPGPLVTRRRYGEALRAFQKAVRKLFKNTRLERTQIEHALWYRFAPDYRFELVRLSFKSGMHVIDGDFAVAFYAVGEHRYACFPKLDNLTLRIESYVRQRPALIDFLTAKLTAHYRQLRRDKGDSFNPKAYFSPSSSSTLAVNTSMDMETDRFSFEHSDATLWAFLSDNQPFNGAQELEKVAEDWSDSAADLLEASYFRDSAAQWLNRALFGDRAQAVAIVGAQGIGKSNIIKHVYREYLAQHRTRPAHQLQKLWLLDPLRVISGMSIVGQWERRFETILRHIRDRQRRGSKAAPPDILLVDNPVALLRVGKTSQTELTLAHLLLPFLQRRDIPCIVTATPQEWQKMVDINRSFADMFQVLRLTPLTAEQNDTIVTRRRAALERHYQCEFSTAALLTLIKTEPGFRGTKELPGSILDIMTDIAVTSQNRRISEQRVYQSLQQSFHINRKIVDRKQILTRDEVAGFFQQNLIGQAGARRILVDTVLAIKAQLTQPGKPLNTLLFIGPTGVGKTEAAKLLTRFVFTREESLVRIDMNEFTDEDAVGRLIGDAYNPYGILTERVRYQKSCVLLLDEVEKAHPRVHDLLLQLLDDGRLTDAMGSTTDFSQTVVVMTSNVGAQEAASHIGFVKSADAVDATYLNSLEKYFRPELINRINHIVLFQALQQQHMEFLAQLHLKKLLQRDGFVRRSTILNVDENCLSHIARQGFDPQLGARALKRNLERIITRSSASSLARLSSDDPIILNMWLQDEEVCADIVRLGYAAGSAQALPTSVRLELADYRAILSRLREADEQLQQAPYVLDAGDRSAADQHRRYAGWTLLDALRDVQEPLQSFVYEFEERLATRRLQIGFSFKPTPAKYYEALRMPRIDFRGIHAHHDIRDYLNTVYQQSPAHLENSKQNQLALWTEVNRLIHASCCYAERGVDRGRLIIRSLVAHKGEEGAGFLVRIYRQLLAQLGQVELIRDAGGARILEVSGPGIKELFDYESGVHLFCEQGNVQVPVIVRPDFNPPAAGQADSHLADKSISRRALIAAGPAEILRVYALSRSAAAAGTVSDLRSGLMMDAGFDTAQWWALLAAAIPDYLAGVANGQ